MFTFLDCSSLRRSNVYRCTTQEIQPDEWYLVSVRYYCLLLFCGLLLRRFVVPSCLVRTPLIYSTVLARCWWLHVDMKIGKLNQKPTHHYLLFHHSFIIWSFHHHSSLY
jgi:hypothetical protein